MNFKYAVLSFRYNNDHFSPLKEELDRNGSYSVNVGDNIQSISVRLLLNYLGIKDEEIISINRDDLPSYDGDQVVLVMNGCFYEQSFPLPEKILPIFIGFNADENVISINNEYFKKYEPIGCRDEHTTELCRKYGIRAYTTGCISMTLLNRTMQPSKTKTFIVYGNGAGELPDTLFSYIPPPIIESAELIYQRLPMYTFPLGDEDVHNTDTYALELLKRYKEEATLVITPLLHAACPCIAMGIPVILARKDYNSRFTALKNTLPVYTPDNFSEINWNIDAINIEKTKKNIINMVKCSIDEAIATLHGNC